MPPGKWTVLLADDEPAARRGVRQLLAAFPEFQVVGECRNGAEVLAALDTLAPEVVFLDIQMPGIDGFEVIRCRTPERMPAVVFLSAYDQHALAAFEAQALDYLVKPVAVARFAATVERLARWLLDAALAAKARAEHVPGLVVPTARGTSLLLLQEIDWIEAADCYARLWVGRRSYLLREPLRALEPKALAHGFLRAHRRALVRLGAVRRLEGRGKVMVAVLGSGVQVPVSRRRRAAFGTALRSWPETFSR